MKLLYQFYLTFFLLHLAYKPTFKPGRSPAWFDALPQVSTGVYCWLFGISYLLANQLGFTSKISSLGNPLVLLVYVLLWFYLYDLSFIQYQVDKQTGLTELDQFTVTKKAKFMVWVFWMGSFAFCGLVPFIRDKFIKYPPPAYHNASYIIVQVQRLLAYEGQ